jgi:hypothetical protein
MARLSPVKPSSTPKSTKHGLPPIDPRAIKRVRLTPSKNDQKENVNHGTSSVPRGLHKEAQGKDEQALLDDLMAGLDASIFEYTPSSPAVSQTTASQRKSSQKVASPIKNPANGMNILGSLGVKERKIKREVLSPTKCKASSGRLLISPKKAQKGAYLKAERKPDVAALQSAPPAVTVKLDVKEESDTFEDGLFEFDLDLDLADFAALDGEASLEARPRVRAI